VWAGDLENLNEKGKSVRRLSSTHQNPLGRDGPVVWGEGGLGGERGWQRGGRLGREFPTGCRAGDVRDFTKLLASAHCKEAAARGVIAEANQAEQSRSGEDLDKV